MRRIKTSLLKYAAEILLRATPLTRRWNTSGRSSEEIEEEINIRISKAMFKWVNEKGYRDKDVNFYDFAHELGVPPLQLSHYFKTRIGMRFTSWRKQLRIDDAEEMLISRPDMPTSDIGQIVGFSDKSNFRRAFRERSGCTPQEWRDRNSGKKV